MCFLLLFWQFKVLPSSKTHEQIVTYADRLKLVVIELEVSWLQYDWDEPW